MKGPQTTVGWSEPAIFGNFVRHVFGTVRVEASILMQRNEVFYRLSSNRTVKRLTLNDLGMPFYAEICFNRRLE